MKVAAELAAVDSVCIVVATRLGGGATISHDAEHGGGGANIFGCHLNRPDQSAETVSDYMVNELAGKDSPKLHLVAFRDADSSTYVRKGGRGEE